MKCLFEGCSLIAENKETFAEHQIRVCSEGHRTALDLSPREIVNIDELIDTEEIVNKALKL